MSVVSAEAALCLLEQAPEILRRWEERVRAQIPASREHKPLALRNNLGRLLGEVARALSPTGVPETRIAGLTLSGDHGGQRAGRTEYRIDEVFLEYRLLRQEILNALEVVRPLAPAEREIINDALERAIQDAVSQFAHVQHEVVQEAGDEARRATAELRTAYDRERRITEVLQRPLFLKVAEDAVPGLSLATFYEPALKEAEVGGDFFDVIPLAGGRVALVVGDTSGKGLEAAVHNTHLKDVLRAFLRESTWRTGATLSRLNNVTCDLMETLDTDQDYRFVVLAILILDTSSGEALYSSAGAEPLLVVRSGGEAEVVELPGLPLGIQREVLYSDTPVQLEPGDTAVLLTDGITEARNAGKLLGYPAMVEMVKEALSAPSLEEAGQQIVAGARAFAGGGLSDDACLILARRP